MKRIADKVAAHALDLILGAAKSTVENVGQWKASFEGASIWIGDKGGSRIGQYEAHVQRGGRAHELHSRTWSGICTQIKKAERVLER